MKQNKGLKLFISYSHEDEEPYIEEFKKHLAPLRDNGLIEEWYDREITPGEDYQSKIDNNLENADIICLLISANFLSSESCKKEKKQALELRRKKGISVIPIILSCCGWLDVNDISKLLALPTDGKPVEKFRNRDEGWLDVYNGLKKVIQQEIKIKQLRIKKEFKKFLQDTELLEKAHPQKERVILDDIFVHLELDKYDELKEYNGKISTKELLEDIIDYSKIVISGEDQSGKTTICKVLFNELRKRHFIPIYISAKRDRLKGKIENKIERAFQKQYEGNDLSEFSQERIIPIIDDFHYAKKKEKYLNDLASYPHCVIIIDDIFSLNVRDERFIADFSYFRINELKPSLRYELIKKWVSLRDPEIGDLEIYRCIDERIELINSVLGKTVGKGILPAYPFFILSAIVTYETFAVPLDREITSQGYCYQALIYFYLKKQDVGNDEIDVYINFLTELAFYFYKQKKYELPPDNFASFMNSYLEKFNLPIEQAVLLKKLRVIVSKDSFNNYSFRYPYIYYFFVAKYLAENITNCEVVKEIEKIMNNLHVDENAYIAIFMVHHSKNVNILDKLKINARRLFDRYAPATLTKEETKFFDEQANIIVEATLPPPATTPEKKRTEIVKIQDEIERFMNGKEKDIEEDDSLERELRRSVRTVEVIGCIIKNRAGSLPKTELEEMFTDAMNVHLRILSSFFEIIKKEDSQKDIIDFLSKRLEKIIAERRESKKELSREDLTTISRTIFWNMNYLTVYGIIFKIVHSLGSDKLAQIIEKICDKINTPAALLVKHGVLMWYKKNLQVNNLAEMLKEKNFSMIAKIVAKMIVAEYCSLHPVTYRDRQKIENILGISAKRFLKRSDK